MIKHENTYITLKRQIGIKTMYIYKKKKRKNYKSDGKHAKMGTYIQILYTLT